MTKRRERNPNKLATGPVPSSLPKAQTKDLNDPGKAWELVRIAYESHFEFANHYSSIVFQARIAITTVMVLAVALGFGYLPNGGSNSIEFAECPHGASSHMLRRC